MPMRPTDRLISPARGNAAAAVSYGQRNGAKRLGEFQQYVAEVVRLAPLLQLDPSIVIAQSAHETSAWSSSWWTSRLNPAGIGITGDPTQNDQSRTWESGMDAARSQLAHELVYAIGPAEAAKRWAQVVPDEPLVTVDPRYSAYVSAYGNTAQAETIAELAGKWGVDPEYAEGVCARGNAIYTTLEDQPMQTYKTAVPGLPGGPLVTTYPITVKLVDPSRTINRPGTKAKSPRYGIQHGNGNPNSSAAGESSWLRSGAPDDSGRPQQLSYHSAADDTGIQVMIPADEITWQAADGFSGPGNNNGYSCEMVEDAKLWANPTRRDRCIANTADFMGRVAARLNIAKPQQHWDFNFALPPSQRHDCPNKLRHVKINGRLAWDIYVQQWQAAKADELQRMNPKPAEPPKPSPLPGAETFVRDDETIFVYSRRYITPVRDVQTYQYADDTSAKGPVLKAGKRVLVYFVVLSGGELWGTTRLGWRFRMSEALLAEAA